MKSKTLRSFLVGIGMLTAGAALAQPANDDCSGAISIQSAFGNAIGTTTILGPYDNTLATTNASDPIVGFECFGEPDGSGTGPTLENTLWFTFTGDGGKYFIETGNGAGITNYINDGDTQIAIYTGSCGAFTPYVCNEDGPSATATTYPAGVTFNTQAGTVYYLMIDGFNFNGAISNGEFLIKVTQQQTIACNAPTVSLGTATANKTFVCPNDSVRFDITGVVTPTVGLVSGLGWVISSADLLGSTDPINDPSLVAGYSVQNPAPTTSFRQYKNDGSLIGTAQVPYGTYYWTPVIFGNGTVAVAPGTFMTQITLDPTCTTTGTSIPVIVYAPGSAACATGLADINGNGFGIADLRPIPAGSEISFKLKSVAAGEVKISVKDLTGRVVKTLNLEATPGLNNVTIDLTGIASGIYNLSATAGTNLSNVKFVKQ